MRSWTTPLGTRTSGKILVTIAGDNPPDIFSYWAGARTQFVTDIDRCDRAWRTSGRRRSGSIIPAGVKAAAIYNDDIYTSLNVHPAKLPF